jgi:hypothetical protein
MRQFVLGSIALLLVLIAIPASAQNNCVSWKCYNPPPYDCPYCDTSFYNGASACSTFNSSGSCFLSGSCNTGMDECEETAGHHCTDMQSWANFLEPRPLNEEWRLVQVKIRSRQLRHKAA